MKKQSLSSLNDSSQSYVDMLNLSSIDELADKLRSFCSKQDQDRIKSKGILR